MAGKVSPSERRMLKEKERKRKSLWFQSGQVTLPEVVKVEYETPAVVPKEEQPIGLLARKNVPEDDE